MFVVQKNEGYTLLEMIVVIGLIALAIGFAGFGLNVIYTNNVNTYASQITNDIKLVQTREMAAKSIDYKLELTYEDSKYTVTMYGVEGTNPVSVLKRYTLPSNMVLKKYNIDEYVPINDAVFDTAADLTFEFDVSSGRLLNGSGAGRYEISSSTTDKKIEFVVIEENGRVYIDE